MAEKDMKRVNDYEMARKLDMLLFNSLNNAAALLAGSFANGIVKVITPKSYVDFAEALFDEVVKRDFLNYGKIIDNRSINKESGKVEIILTEKEGREMDSDAQAA